MSELKLTQFQGLPNFRWQSIIERCLWLSQHMQDRTPKISMPLSSNYSIHNV